jgi:hypothetical protein
MGFFVVQVRPLQTLWFELSYRSVGTPNIQNTKICAIIHAVFYSLDRRHFSGLFLHDLGVTLLIILASGLTICPHHCLYYGVSHI